MMAVYIKECGQIIRGMVWGVKSFLMGRNIMGCSIQASKKDKATINGRIHLNTKENGDIMSSGVVASTYGRTAGDMTANGSTPKCMAKESIHG